MAPIAPAASRTPGQSRPRVARDGADAPLASLLSADHRPLTGALDRLRPCPAGLSRSCGQPIVLPGIRGISLPHGRQPGVDPGRAILADHDRLSRSMQRPADELTEVTISPRHGSPPQPSLRCLDGQCLSRLTRHTATRVENRSDAPREPLAPVPGWRAVLGELDEVASRIRCKSGLVPGFMIRLGDGADSFGVIGGLAGGRGAWPELARWLEQRAAQVLQEPQAV